MDSAEHSHWHPANRLTDKVIVVTGGSRGIGLSVATALAAEGARVAICARDADEIDAACGLIRAGVDEFRQAGTGVPTDIGEIIAQRADVTNEDELRDFFAGVQEKWGRLDALVSNAGMSGPRLQLSRLPVPLWNEVLAVNLTGAFLAARAALKIMRPQNSGSIVHVTATAGRGAAVGFGAYAVSKWGIEGLTRTLADELADSGIRVNCVNPGPTRTRMRAEAYPQEDAATIKPPDIVVPIFVWLCSDASAGLSGQSLDAESFDLAMLDATKARSVTP